MWIKPGMLVWDNSANSHNNWGESPQAFCQTLPKRVFFRHQYNAGFWTLIVLILHWFQPFLKEQTRTDVQEHMSVRNFWISAKGFCKPPKNWPWKQYFGWDACYQLTAQTAQFCTTEISLGASQHPKDVPFCTWAVMGDVLWLPEDMHFIVNTTPCSLISRSRKNTV